MKNLKLNTQSIKVNPENYIAMTHGFQMEGKNVHSPIHISDSGTHCHFWKIYSARSSDYFLLTCGESTTHHRHQSEPANSKLIREWMRGDLCDIVRHRDGTINIKNHYQDIYGYAVRVDKIYDIRGDSHRYAELFEELCSNGLFNQWNYIAPCHRLMGKQCGGAQIGLLRVYNLLNPVSRDNIWTYEDGISRYWDELDDTSRNATIINPVIPDDEFDNMRIKLESSLNKHGALIKTSDV